jgi:hypothetical protein
MYLLRFAFRISSYLILGRDCRSGATDITDPPQCLTRAGRADPHAGNDGSGESDEPGIHVGHGVLDVFPSGAKLADMVPTAVPGVELISGVAQAMAGTRRRRCFRRAVANLPADRSTDGRRSPRDGVPVIVRRQRPRGLSPGFLRRSPRCGEHAVQSGVERVAGRRGQVRRRHPHRRLPVAHASSHLHAQSVGRQIRRVDPSGRAASRPYPSVTTDC